MCRLGVLKIQCKRIAVRAQANVLVHMTKQVELKNKAHRRHANVIQTNDMLTKG